MYVCYTVRPAIFKNKRNKLLCTHAQTLTQTKQLQIPIKQAINTFHLTQMHANKGKTQQD